MFLQGSFNTCQGPATLVVVFRQGHSVHHVNATTICRSSDAAAAAGGSRTDPGGFALDNSNSAELLLGCPSGQQEGQQPAAVPGTLDSGELIVQGRALPHAPQLHSGARSQGAVGGDAVLPSQSNGATIDIPMDDI
jgi:hypothetical protein